MALADQLQESLRLRTQQAALEYAAGDELEAVLDRHLRAIEASGGDLLTSVLLLDDDGKRLLHGAAPNLPKAYSEAIHGIAIGPKAGSCGTDPSALTPAGSSVMRPGSGASSACRTAAPASRAPCAKAMRDPVRPFQTSAR